MLSNHAAAGTTDERVASVVMDGGGDDRDGNNTQVHHNNSCCEENSAADGSDNDITDEIDVLSLCDTDTATVKASNVTITVPKMNNMLDRTGHFPKLRDTKTMSANNISSDEETTNAETEAAVAANFTELLSTCEGNLSKKRRLLLFYIELFIDPSIFNNADFDLSSHVKEKYTALGLTNPPEGTLDRFLFLAATETDIYESVVELQQQHLHQTRKQSLEQMQQQDPQQQQQLRRQRRQQYRSVQRQRLRRQGQQDDANFEADES